MTKNNNILFCIFFVLSFVFNPKVSAQEIRVIDNKGTRQTVNNNNVTTSVTAPTNPVENDIWFDTSTTPNSIKIWDGTSWLNINNNIPHTGTEGSVFFAGPTGEPIENNNQLFWDNSLLRLSIGSPLAGANKLTVQGAIRSTAFNNAPGTAGTPSYRFSSDSDTGMFRAGTNELGFTTGGTSRLNISNTETRVFTNLRVDGSFIDSSGDAGTAGQILSSTATGTNWINNAATNNWLVTGNSGTTNANFLGTIDDVRMQIRSNNVSMLEFGRRQTLGLTEPGRTDYDVNDQSLVYLNGSGGTSALQFRADGASFYKPMFFTTSNGSFRLKGSTGRTDFFEIGSAGPDNDGRLEFIVGDDGTEPIVFKRFDYRSGEFYREFFRVQGSNNTTNAKTRFGININQNNYPVTSNLNANSNGGTPAKIMANSTFQVNGSVSKSIINITTGSGDFNLTEDHYTILMARNRRIVLPDASTCIGRIYILKNTRNGLGSVPTSPSYRNSFNNLTNSILANTVVQLQSDGNQWHQIN